MYRLRFLFVMWRALWAAPQSIRMTYYLDFTAIPFFDTDVTRLFTQTYASLTGLGRWHYVFSSHFRQAAVKSRWIPVTTAETFVFYRSIKAFEKIDLKTELICWNDRCFFVRQTFSSRGEVKAVSISEGIVRCGKKHLRPGDVFKALGATDESPEFPSEIVAWTNYRQAIN